MGLLVPRFLVPRREQVGDGITKLRTRTQAQKFTTDFRSIESAFPQCLNLPDCNQRWQYLVSVMGAQGTLDPEMWDYIGRFRSAIGQPRREVRDKVVTTAFVDFIVDQLQTETSVFGDFKYHDSGIGTGAEAAGDTALGTPWGGSRDTGTQTETDHDTYKSVATTTYNATKAITEHGLFNTSDTVTLMDRTKFDATNVVDTNQIGNGLPLAQVNGQYGVNCGNSKGKAYDNPQPSPVNDIKVTGKVQRLEVEESTNKTSNSAPHPATMDEEIVQAERKLSESLASSPLR